MLCCWEHSGQPHPSAECGCWPLFKCHESKVACNADLLWSTDDHLQRPAVCIPGAKPPDCRLAYAWWIKNLQKPFRVSGLLLKGTCLILLHDIGSVTVAKQLLTERVTLQRCHVSLMCAAYTTTFLPDNHMHECLRPSQYMHSSQYAWHVVDGLQEGAGYLPRPAAKQCTNDPCTMDIWHCTTPTLHRQGECTGHRQPWQQQHQQQQPWQWSRWGSDSTEPAAAGTPAGMHVTCTTPLPAHGGPTRC